jgi:hypothetical protein
VLYDKQHTFALFGSDAGLTNNQMANLRGHRKTKSSSWSTSMTSARWAGTAGASGILP